MTSRGFSEKNVVSKLLKKNMCLLNQNSLCPIFKVVPILWCRLYCNCNDDGGGGGLRRDQRRWLLMAMVSIIWSLRLKHTHIGTHIYSDGT